MHTGEVQGHSAPRQHQWSYQERISQPAVLLADLVLYKGFEESLPPPFPHPTEEMATALERVGKKLLEDFDPSKGGYCWPLRQKELS